MRIALLGLSIILCIPVLSFSQDEKAISGGLSGFPAGYFKKIDSQTGNVDKALTEKTNACAERLTKMEARLRKKMFGQDSVQAKKILGNEPMDYRALLQKIQDKEAGLTKTGGGSYIPYLDSMKTSLKFMQQNKTLLNNSKEWQDKVDASMSHIKLLEQKMQAADRLKELIRQRRDQIRQALAGYSHLPSSLQRSYQGYSQEVYYYGARVKQYKQELNDPDKLTKRGLALLNRMPVFNQFMKDHSDLAALFSLPPHYGTGQSLNGLQNRPEIVSMIEKNAAAAGPDAGQAIQQNMQKAQSTLNSLKDKARSYGNSGGDMNMPEYKPNMQHTKTFLQRLEYGLNFQSTGANYAFPGTTDLGLSLGYKLNDGNTIGIGGSYKIGWGKDLHHIAVSSQGLGLRSYLDSRIKGTFYLTGGFEYNYARPFSSVSQLGAVNEWTRSGLIGLSKKFRISSKVKGNIQLLWDFLSYSQLPRTQPLKFRVGYNF